MIDILRKNVEKEIEILREISLFSKRMENAGPVEKTLFSEGLEALTMQMRESNNRILEILKDVEPTIAKKSESETAQLTAKKEKKDGRAIFPAIKQGIDREKFLKELEITSEALKKIKKEKTLKTAETAEFREARGYLKTANKFFLNSASKLIKKGYFGSLPQELRKSNLEILFETYVAMILFSVFLSFFASLFLLVFLLFFNITLGWPIVEAYAGSFMSRLLKLIWLPIAIPIGTLLVLYRYPSAEKNSISRRITEEIPFAVIHMSSISGSGIEPTEIFKIVALSKEYPFLRKEIRKVLNQINIYGYDFVTALNNVSKSTPNTALAELFSGLATNISSGGGLPEFFEKRAETLLNNYRLDREKSIKIAETSMDIYISVVIAAPMILMLMLVMISISGIQIGFTPYELTFMTIGGVALINVVFLTYLQTKRTIY